MFCYKSCQCTVSVSKANNMAAIQVGSIFILYNSFCKRNFCRQEVMWFKICFGVFKIGVQWNASIKYHSIRLSGTVKNTWVLCHLFILDDVSQPVVRVSGWSENDSQRLVTYACNNKCNNYRSATNDTFIMGCNTTHPLTIRLEWYDHWWSVESKRILKELAVA